MAANISPPEALQDVVRALEAEVAQLGSRVTALERELSVRRTAERAPMVIPANDPPVARPADAVKPAAGEAQVDLGAAVRLGRTSVILGGAFALRALTESGTLDGTLGVALGLAYAAIWVAFTGRAARLGALSDATWYGFAASAIANPLIFEATTRFEALPVPIAALLTLLFGGGLLTVAWRRNLRGLAWVATTAALMTAGGLVFKTLEPWPFIAVLVASAGGALAISYHSGWVPLRWSVALVMNTVVLGATLAFFVERQQLNLTSSQLVGLQLLVAGVSLATILVLALGRGLKMGLFEVGEAATSAVIALELAPRVLAAEGAGFVVPGAIATGLAVVGFALVAWRWRRDVATNLGCYAGVAALLAVQGLLWVVPPVVAEVSWLVMALAAAWLTRDSDNPALRLTAAGLLLVAAATSGLIHAVVVGLGARSGLDWHPIAWRALLVVAAAASTYLILRWRAGDERTSWPWTGPGAAALVIAAWGLAAAAVLVIAPFVARVGTPDPDAGALAATRTGALTILIWGLAFLGRSRQRPELLWAAYATLSYAGLKVLVEDLPNGRPTTLFITFVLVGSLLMLLPRLIRRPVAARPAEAASPAEAAIPVEAASPAPPLPSDAPETDPT